MNNLEQLVAEYYDWKDYLIKRNVLVGKRINGGYEMELDLVAYQPHTKHLIHIEASLDSFAWPKRKLRFEKKFQKGREYIFSEVFTWLDAKTPIEQFAILPTKPKGNVFGNMKALSIDEFYHNVMVEIMKEGKASKAAIPEQYFMLRTIQFVLNGYHSSPNEMIRNEISKEEVGASSSAEK